MLVPRIDRRRRKLKGTAPKTLTNRHRAEWDQGRPARNRCYKWLRRAARMQEAGQHWLPALAEAQRLGATKAEAKKAGLDISLKTIDKAWADLETPGWLHRARNTHAPTRSRSRA